MGEHYKNKCPPIKEVKKVNSKLGKFHNNINPCCRRKEAKKGYVVCFTCRERSHYHTKCPNKEVLRKIKGGKYKIKGIQFLIKISNFVRKF